MCLAVRSCERGAMLRAKQVRVSRIILLVVAGVERQSNMELSNLLSVCNFEKHKAKVLVFRFQK